MSATLSRARLKLQLDVSFGDPVTPAPAPVPVPVEYPQYLTGETFILFGHPIATVIAEKLSTAIALGDLNTRDRDYADLHQLITRHHLDGDELTTTLRNTANHRGIQLRPLSEAISGLPTRRQAPYTAWRRRQGHAADNHPATFADLVATVTAFADPLATGAAHRRIWNPVTRTWHAP